MLTAASMPGALSAHSRKRPFITALTRAIGRSGQPGSEVFIRPLPFASKLTEEQELQIVRRRLANFPEAMRAVMQAAHALRRPVTEVTATDVESWANTSQQI